MKPRKKIIAKTPNKLPPPLDFGTALSQRTDKDLLSPASTNRGPQKSMKKAVTPRRQQPQEAQKSVTKMKSKTPKPSQS